MAVTVGANFPGLSSTSHRMVRMPSNPMDKCTIVSVYPKRIDETKPTVFPGRFIIEAAKDDDFELLVVTPSSWWKEMEEGQPYLEIPHSSPQIAHSVITDYCNGLFGCNMADMMPGLFYIPGAYNKKTAITYLNPETKENFDDLLKKAREKQKKYFVELVRLADIMWAKSQGNPLSISDDARIACEKLHLQKAWMKDFSQVQLEPCKACGQMVNTNYPVCQHCHAIINLDRAKELNIQFAARG